MIQKRTITNKAVGMDLIRSTLISKNITVQGKRTSVRLEPPMWEALFEISKKENISLNEICTHVHYHKEGSSLTSALRVFILTYYRFPKTNSFKTMKNMSQAS